MMVEQIQGKYKQPLIRMINELERYVFICQPTWQNHHFQTQDV